MSKIKQAFWDELMNQQEQPDEPEQQEVKDGRNEGRRTQGGRND